MSNKTAAIDTFSAQMARLKGKHMKKEDSAFLTLIAAEVNQIAVCLEGIMMSLEYLAMEEEEEDADEQG